jgi:hypothetical protein
MKILTRNSKRRILRKSQGAITIFQIIPLYAIIIGICIGVKLGSVFGHIGAGIGGVVGGILGLLCWRLPLMWICKWLDRKRNLSNKTVEELRAMLRDPNCPIPNVALLELGMRKQNMEQELPVVLDMLVSPLKQRRSRGWRTLASVFPERAKLVADYRVDDSVEKCKEKIQKILPIQK